MSIGHTLRGQRLLRDIAELQTHPYPNIELHLHEDDLMQACLILTAEEYGSLHLTIEFSFLYPLEAPKVHMDSKISHPHVFDDYICASILNDTDGYTPAYTLKGIAIQLLSFFASDSVEDEYGGSSAIADYRTRFRPRELFKCSRCSYLNGALRSVSQSSAQLSLQDMNSSDSMQHMLPSARGKVQSIPPDVLLLICDDLETEDMLLFAQAWPYVAELVTNYGIIRQRELACFCFKLDYRKTRLGVGINIGQTGRIKSLQSEFDLLSWEAFHQHRIRRSIMGLSFTHWLPLPLSQAHWARVKSMCLESLQDINLAAQLSRFTSDHKPSKTVYHFMNCIVVRLNEIVGSQERDKSNLRHASEKAIESYFHLFHLLLCLSTETPQIVRAANETLEQFSKGKTSKVHVPDIGHLLIAALISDVEISPLILRAIIKEVITRNVVWMLDMKGANMPELSYMEKSAVSGYRLKKTFEASKTSYSLLMFLNVFRKKARGDVKRPLLQVRSEAFARLGAPPHGAAKSLADSIKQIHDVNSFPQFLKWMDLPMPSPENFTTFLRQTVRNSMDTGYSRWALVQGQALAIRIAKEPHVEVNQGDHLRRDVQIYPGMFFSN